MVKLKEIVKIEEIRKQYSDSSKESVLSDVKALGKVDLGIGRIQIENYPNFKKEE